MKTLIAAILFAGLASGCASTLPLTDARCSWRADLATQSIVTSGPRQTHPRFEIAPVWCSR